MRDFVNRLFEKNQKINLVGAKTKEEIWRRHVEDSLILNKFLKIERGWKVLDLGTGGGFPGVPLAITNPEAEFSLLDSKKKKIEALMEILNLKFETRNSKQIQNSNDKNSRQNLNIDFLVGRAEDLGKDRNYCGRFNLVIARALAKLPKTLKTAEPFTANRGLFVYWGTKNTRVKTQSLTSLQNLKCERFEEYLLPGDTVPRRLVFYRKLV